MVCENDDKCCQMLCETANRLDNKQCNAAEMIWGMEDTQHLWYQAQSNFTEAMK